MKGLTKYVQSALLSSVVLMSANNTDVTPVKQLILNSNLHVSSALRPTALRLVLTHHISASPKVTSYVYIIQIQKTRLKRQNT